MNLSHDAIAKKKIELEEALAQREATATALEALKEETKERRSILARLDSRIRELALEVATEKGEGDQLSISVSLATAEERTASLPLDREPPEVSPLPVDGPSDAAVKLALVRVLESEADWVDEGALFEAVINSFPECKPGASQLGRALTDLKRAGRVELSDGIEGETEDGWRVVSKTKGKKGDARG